MGKFKVLVGREFMDYRNFHPSGPWDQLEAV